MLRKVSSSLVAAAFALTPISAQAQSCDMLRAQIGGTSGDMLGIAQDYPKTHIAIVACLLSQDTDDNRSGCAAAIVLGACIAMGSEYCNDLTNRWERAGANYQRIAARMREQGCRQ